MAISTLEVGAKAASSACLASETSPSMYLEKLHSNTIDRNHLMQAGLYHNAFWGGLFGIAFVFPWHNYFSSWSLRAFLIGELAADPLESSARAGDCSSYNAIRHMCTQRQTITPFGQHSGDFHDERCQRELA